MERRTEVMETKHRLLILPMVLLATLACSVFQRQPSGEGVVSEMAIDESPAPDSFSLVNLEPSQGDLPALLAAHADRATGLERRPFVEFSAEWCPSCLQLERSLDDARMIEAFRGTYIIRLDIDAWKSRLSRTGFIVLGVPAIFEVDGEGLPTGRAITGAAWGEDIPENMAPVLGEFFQAEG